MFQSIFFDQHALISLPALLWHASIRKKNCLGRLSTELGLTGLTHPELGKNVLPRCLRHNGIWDAGFVSRAPFLLARVGRRVPKRQWSSAYPVPHTVWSKFAMRCWILSGRDTRKVKVQEENHKNRSIWFVVLVGELRNAKGRISRHSFRSHTLGYPNRGFQQKVTINVLGPLLFFLFIEGCGEDGYPRSTSSCGDWKWSAYDRNCMHTSWNIRENREPLMTANKMLQIIFIFVKKIVRLGEDLVTICHNHTSFSKHKKLHWKHYDI